MATAPVDIISIKSDQVKKWYPKKVIFTREAMGSPYVEKIRAEVKDLGIEMVETLGNRISGIKGKTDAETYRNAKSTMAVVKAPPSQFRLQPIPPSADYQFHLAQGCPAHCQYCYLAGSLSGLPVVKVYGNLEDILENTQLYEKDDKVTSFEVSCYTDPLSLEHLTGGLSTCISYFSGREKALLRWVSKFDYVEPLLHLQHNGRTRCRISINPEELVRGYEAGTANFHQRLKALHKLSDPILNAGGAYPVGLVIAPIMAIDQWEDAYGTLFETISKYISPETDLTFEFITHRFTPKSKSTLLDWYPNTKLNLEEVSRVEKTNKFGGTKYVYPNLLMKALKIFFYSKTNQLFPSAKILYWT